MSERLFRAMCVRGWMSQAELSWLESAASGKPLVIEFGSWRGRSSVALAAAQRLVCVDLFVDQPQEQGTGADILADFTLAIGDDADHVEPIRGSLRDDAFASSLVERFGGAADVVFIDASHDEESVRKDIAIAKKLVTAGGMLCGHDYSSAWPGVVTAVNSLVPGVNRAADSIWWSTK